MIIGISDFVCDGSVCLCVRTLKRKRLETSTPNLVHMYFMAVAQHSSLTQTLKGQRTRSHGYENRHGRTAASEASRRCRCDGTARRTTVSASNLTRRRSFGVVRGARTTSGGESSGS